MKLIFAFAVIAALVFGACSSAPAGMKLPTTALTASLPVPSGVVITAPTSAIPPQTAAFSGIWEGKWNNYLASRVIVERIDGSKATVVYEWGDTNLFKRGWERVQADVTAPGIIHWFSRADFTFTMSKDRRTIAGKYVLPAGTSTVTMTKVA